MGWDAGEHWLAALELSQLFAHGFWLTAFKKMNALAAYWPPLPTLWTSVFHMVAGPSYSVAVFSTGMLAVVFTTYLARQAAFAPVTRSGWDHNSSAADMSLGITVALLPWFLPLFQRYVLTSMFEVAGLLLTLVAFQLYVANLSAFRSGELANWRGVGAAALAVVLVKYYYAIYLFGAFFCTAWILVRGSRRVWTRPGSVCAVMCLLLALAGARLGATFDLGRHFIKGWLWGCITAGIVLLLVELTRSRHPFWRPFALWVLLPTAVWMTIPNPNRYWAIWALFPNTAGSECMGLTGSSGCWGYYPSHWARYGGELLAVGSVALTLGLLFLLKRGSDYLRVWYVASGSYAVLLFLVMTFVSRNKQSRYIITLIPLALLGSVFFVRTVSHSFLWLRQWTVVKRAVQGASVALCAGLCAILMVSPLKVMSDRIFQIEAHGIRPAGEDATLKRLFDELRTTRIPTRVFFDYPFSGEFHARWLLHEIELGVATPPKFFGNVRGELLRSSNQWVGALEDATIQRFVVVTFESGSNPAREAPESVLNRFEQRVLGAGEGRIWILERRTSASRVSVGGESSPTPVALCRLRGRDPLFMLAFTG